MVVKCDTREEAEELQSNCAICGLEKFAIKSELFDRKMQYSIGKCFGKGCTIHCQGHTDRKISVDLGDGYKEAPTGLVLVN